MPSLLLPIWHAALYLSMLFFMEEKKCKILKKRISLDPQTEGETSPTVTESMKS